jgi:hypothetical protein
MVRRRMCSWQDLAAAVTTEARPTAMVVDRTSCGRGNQGRGLRRERALSWGHW